MTSFLCGMQIGGNFEVFLIVGEGQTGEPSSLTSTSTHRFMTSFLCGMQIGGNFEVFLIVGEGQTGEPSVEVHRNKNQTDGCFNTTHP